MSGSENAGLVACETKNPRKSVPKAVGSMWIRLALFYVIGSLMVTICVDPNNPNLFGGSGTNASPFVIAYRESGLGPLAHIMNAVIFVSVLSTGSISGYAGSRTLVGLAQIGMAPKVSQLPLTILLLENTPLTQHVPNPQVLMRADKVGRPWFALVPTLLIGGGLAYLNVNNSGAEVFSWFSNLTSLFTLFGWGMICLSHIRMRHAWKVQGRDINDLPWKSWTFPYGAYWGLFWCILLIIVEFYLAVWPQNYSHDPTTRATSFFSTYVSVIAIVVVYIVGRILYRGPWWVSASKIDLDAGRRFYSEEQMMDEPNGTLKSMMQTLVH